MLKVRIYPKVPGTKPMIFHDVENVKLDRDGSNWVLEFDHIDYVRKDVAVGAHSVFTSESAMAYTFLYDEVNTNQLKFKYKIKSKGEK